MPLPTPLLLLAASAVAAHWLPDPSLDLVAWLVSA
ncbi:MAG: hypothetical protein JWM40_747, partial [Frankiales bacterium]|nr:hypothetical protein [Frankiales bacterium]